MTLKAKKHFLIHFKLQIVFKIRLVWLRLRGSVSRRSWSTIDSLSFFIIESGLVVKSKLIDSRFDDGERERNQSKRTKKSTLFLVERAIKSSIGHKKFDHYFGLSEKFEGTLSRHNLTLTFTSHVL